MKLKIYGTQVGMKEVGFHMELGFGYVYDGSVYVPEELNDIKEIEKLAVFDALDRGRLTVEIEKED